MNLLIAIAFGIAGVTAFAVILVVMFMREVDKNRAALDEAKKAEADAELQATYADIGAQQHDDDTTAGVLDRGKFFVSPVKGVQPPRADEGGSGTKGES